VVVGPLPYRHGSGEQHVAIRSFFSAPCRRPTATRAAAAPLKLSARQQAELVRMHGTGEYTTAELMEVFSVGRATVYRVLDRAGAAQHRRSGAPS
jgi:hypothetical protein